MGENVTVKILREAVHFLSPLIGCACIAAGLLTLYCVAVGNHAFMEFMFNFRRQNPFAKVQPKRDYMSDHYRRLLNWLGVMMVIMGLGFLFFGPF